MLYINYKDITESVLRAAIFGSILALELSFLVSIEIMHRIQSTSEGKDYGEQEF